MNAVVIILYEDQRGPTKEFGLHNLVTACVADHLGRTFQEHAFRQLLDGRPMKGIDKVPRSCRSEVPRIAPRGQTVFVLVDDDEVRRHLHGEGIAANAPAADVVQAIKARSSAPDQLEVVLLERNMETVLEAAGECDKSLNQAMLADALGKGAGGARPRLEHGRLAPRSGSTRLYRGAGTIPGAARARRSCAERGRHRALNWHQNPRPFLTRPFGGPGGGQPQSSALRRSLGHLPSR